MKFWACYLGWSSLGSILRVFRLRFLPHSKWTTSRRKKKQKNEGGGKKILDSNLCRRASYRAGGSALMFILLLDCSRRLFNFRPAARKWPKAMHIDILLTSNKKALWALSFFACHPKQSVSSDPSIRGMRSLMMLSKTHPSLMSVKHEEDPYFLVATSHWSK